MARKTVLIAVMLIATIVMTATMYVFSVDITIAESQERFFKNAPYDYIYEYKGEIVYPNSYYNITNKVSLQTQDGSKLHATVLMEKEVGTYTFFSSSLNNNDVIVSKNLSKNYELSENSQIFLTIPTRSDSFNLQVKVQNNDCYELTSSSFNRYSGLVIIDYHEDIAKDNNLSSYTFLNEQDELSGDYLLVAIHSKEKLIKEVKNKRILNALYVSLIIFIEIVIVIIIIGVLSMSIIRHYFSIGMSLKNIGFFLLENGVAELSMALLLAVIIISVYMTIAFGFFSWTLVVIVVIELMIAFLCSMMLLLLAYKKV